MVIVHWYGDLSVSQLAVVAVINAHFDVAFSFTRRCCLTDKSPHQRLITNTNSLNICAITLIW
jgi:hypothetical protein